MLLSVGCNKPKIFWFYQIENNQPTIKQTSNPVFFPSLLTDYPQILAGFDKQFLQKFWSVYSTCPVKQIVPNKRKTTTFDWLFNYDIMSNREPTKTVIVFFADRRNHKVLFGFFWGEGEENNNRTVVKCIVTKTQFSQ